MLSGITALLDTSIPAVNINSFLLFPPLGFGGDGVPQMDEQRREHKVRGQGQPEGVQGWRTQGRIEARLRQRLPVHCHVRCRLSA